MPAHVKTMLTGVSLQVPVVDCTLALGTWQGINKQIAYELSVSEATVKVHVSAILQKLGVESHTQAVIAASKIELGQWPQSAPAGH